MGWGRSQAAQSTQATLHLIGASVAMLLLPHLPRIPPHLPTPQTPHPTGTKTHCHVFSPAVVIHSVVPLVAGTNPRERLCHELLVKGKWVIQGNVAVADQRKPAHVGGWVAPGRANGHVGG